MNPIDTLLRQAAGRRPAADGLRSPDQIKAEFRRRRAAEPPRPGLWLRIAAAAVAALIIALGWELPPAAEPRPRSETVVNLAWIYYHTPEEHP